MFPRHVGLHGARIVMQLQQPPSTVWWDSSFTVSRGSVCIIHNRMLYIQHHGLFSKGYWWQAKRSLTQQSVSQQHCNGPKQCDQESRDCISQRKIMDEQEARDTIAYHVQNTHNMSLRHCNLLSYWSLWTISTARSIWIQSGSRGEDSQLHVTYYYYYY